MSYFYCRNFNKTCHILGSFNMYQTESLNFSEVAFVFDDILDAARHKI